MYEKYKKVFGLVEKKLDDRELLEVLCRWKPGGLHTKDAGPYAPYKPTGVSAWR